MIETAHRCLMNFGQVLRYAIATGRAERDLSQDLRGALAPYNEKHFATIVEPKQVGALMRAIDGYTGGFISMACTLLNEQGWNRDAIERQLAHSERDQVRAAYNYADYLPERRKMMQAWADYLDGLRRGAEVVGIGVARVA